jgi:hypothetical protein
MRDIRYPDVALITFNVVPKRNETLKYSHLGQLGVANHRDYCRRHGYTFIDDVAIASDRPACWAKIPAILSAFANHGWVVCADSDTFILDFSRPLPTSRNAAHDMVVQSPRRWFQFMGLDPALGLQIQPVHTGVFAMRASAWSRSLLEQAYSREQFITPSEIWNGVGEQEAINAVLEAHPEYLANIGYVDDLQAPPQLYRGDTTFVHFYGNHAAYRYDAGACKAVIASFEQTLAGDAPVPQDLAAVHWCAIQNTRPDSPVDRGGPRKFRYEPERLDRLMSIPQTVASAGG